MPGARFGSKSIVVTSADYKKEQVGGTYIVAYKKSESCAEAN